jgi:hypothetical protein
VLKRSQKQQKSATWQLKPGPQVSLMFVQKQFCFLIHEFKKQEPSFLGFCMPPEASIPLSLLLVAAPKTLKSALQFDCVDT